MRKGHELGVIKMGPLPILFLYSPEAVEKVSADIEVRYRYMYAPLFYANACEACLYVLRNVLLIVIHILVSYGWTQ